MREPAVYRLLTFHVPNLMSIFLSLGRLSRESVKVQGPLWHFVTNLFFYGEELLAPCPAPKLEDHSLPAVRNCFFNIFTATLHIWKPSPPSATWGCTMLWWQGTHLNLKNWKKHFVLGCLLTVHSEMLHKTQSHCSPNLIFADFLDTSYVGYSRLTWT
jgi:hypothetical protein